METINKSETLILYSDQNDPYFNQALEYYLLTELEQYHQIFFLWINAPCAFIGRNQNPWKELKLDKMEANEIPLLRRKSGGGTVYHDEGNLNVSFISPHRKSDGYKNLRVIQAAASKFGLQLQATDRYDLRWQGHKVTGSAFYMYKKRKMHHCTLLVDVDESALWEVLNFEHEAYQSKSVKSIKSPVVNLKKGNDIMSMERIKASVIEAIATEFNLGHVSVHKPQDIVEDWDLLRHYVDGFKSLTWLYGETPDFKYTSETGREYQVKKGQYQGHFFSESLITYFESKSKKDGDKPEGGMNVLFENYNPLTDEMIQIMDKDGHIVHPELKPDIPDEKLLSMYKTMVKSRVTDTKTLQFQRQGRILTYAPNLGQEAAQVGTIAASEKTDWVASAFRELGAWLYREAPLYKILLYWYGNEEGMKMPEDVRILPVSIPIASQLQHATGLAYASVYKGENDVVLGYVGDGGTSQGDFHEALNFAGVMNVPCVFIVQNNQFAISTRRAIQTRAKTIAQKSLAYGIPGYQVDGNDIFAVYAVTKMAVDRARNGEGPTLIEAYTYRLGAHTTADDPTVYRDNTEVEEWQEKDPIDRFRKYLIAQGLWNDEKDEALRKEYEDEVRSTFEEVEKSGLVPLEDVFSYTYEKMTPALENQYKELKRRAEEGK